MDQPSLRRVAPDTPTIDEAAAHLRRGGIVAFPTETVYGLGANAARQVAIEALYRLKQRPADHPLIVHVAGVADASSWARLNPAALSLIGALWPGPLTLVLPRRADSPAYACAGQKTIALRCPSHPVARALLNRFSALGGKGVAAPSANPYGRISPTDADQVEEDLQAMMQAHALGRKRLHDPQIPDCWLIDGGACEAGIESTVLDLSTEQARVLRPGAIPRQQIEALLGREVPWVRAADQGPPAKGRRDEGGSRTTGNSIRTNLSGRVGATQELPRVSGTHLAHYAPRKPLVLADANSLAAKLGELAGLGVASVAMWGGVDDVEGGEGPSGTLGLGDNRDSLVSNDGNKGLGDRKTRHSDRGLDHAHRLQIHQHPMPGSVQEVAHQLYRQLRQMDHSEAQVLLVVLPTLAMPPFEGASGGGSWDQHDATASPAPRFNGSFPGTAGATDFSPTPESAATPDSVVTREPGEMREPGETREPEEMRELGETLEPAASSPDAWEAVLDRLRRAAYATSAGLVPLGPPEVTHTAAASTPAPRPQRDHASISEGAFGSASKGSGFENPGSGGFPASPADAMDFDVSFDDLV
jgi:L-threonylcarbamoyladenylate synthase